MAGLFKLGVVSAVAALLAGQAATASDEPRSGSVERVRHQLSEMVHVPAGGFIMGAPDKDTDEVADVEAMCVDEFGDKLASLICRDGDRFDRLDAARPRRRVYLNAYAIDRFEVTVAEYRRCVAARVCDAAPLLLGDQRYHRPELPIVNATYADATTHCKWRGKRLPTEAEWEKAARGTDGRRWPWGNHWRPDGANHGRLEPKLMGELRVVRLQSQFPRSLMTIGSSEDGFGQVAPGPDMLWSESPYGAYNMAGNVAEWVFDYYSEDGYDGLPEINPVRRMPQKHETRRVIRGGSWLLPRLHGLTYDRYFGYLSASKQLRRRDLGFRCASDER